MLDFVEACRAEEGRLRQNGEEALLHKCQRPSMALSIDLMVNILGPICKKLESVDFNAAKHCEQGWVGMGIGGSGRQVDDKRHRPTCTIS